MNDLAKILSVPPPDFYIVYDPYGHIYMTTKTKEAAIKAAIDLLIAEDISDYDIDHYYYPCWFNLPIN